MTCSTCNGESDGYKCAKCGAEADEHNGNHSCGGEMYQPKCKSCGEAEANCTCY